MNLLDIFPELPEFHIKSTGKSYKLRPPNLMDRARFVEWLGDQEQVEKVFKQLQWEVLVKLVFRLLEDKSDFEAMQFEDYNDDGEKVKYLLTGPARLLKAITSLEEGLQMVGALTTAMRLGDPMIDKAMTEAENDSKKKLLKNQTGSKSTTA